jgi:hypothetical protein
MVRKETVIRGISEKGKSMLQPELASFLSRSPSFFCVCSLACAPARVSVLFVNRIVNYSRNSQKGDRYKWNIGEREKFLQAELTSFLPRSLARCLSSSSALFACVGACGWAHARFVFCTVRCFLCSSALFMFCGEISDFFCSVFARCDCSPSIV